MRSRLMKVGNFVLAGFLLFSAAACGGESATTPMAMATPQTAGIVGPESGSAEHRGFASSAMAEATSTTGGGMAPLESRTLTITGDKPDPVDMPEAFGPTTSGEEEKLNTGRTVPQSNYQSPLTAGQVDDNAKFAEYLDYLRNSQFLSVLPMDVGQRLFVRVLDNAQQAVAGARVQLFDGNRQVFDGLTVSDGRVLFFPGEAGADQAQELRALITRGNQQVEAKLRPDLPEHTASITLPDNTGPVGLDIVFLMDATGSMNDEIEELKATVGSIASRIEQLPGSSKPRLGLVAYRDQGDDYVTRSWDFTSDVQQFSANLANVQAGGGGDYPEAVNAGLHDAINLPGWADTSSGRHLRMIVLVGDAPPHLDYPNDPRYTHLLQEAVAAGIKIFPIGASSLDDTGEYIFRQFAQVTQGQFIFLTYDNGVSGAPGPATDKHVSDFTVRNLDSLVVNLVAGEVANQTGQQVEVNSPLPADVTHTIPAPGGWLTRLDNMLQSAVDQLMNVNTAFWLAVLLTMLLWARRTGERARVAALPRPMPAELDLPGGSIQDDWVSGGAEARWRLESDAELYSNMTRQVAPSNNVRAAQQGGEPTLPLGSLPFIYYRAEDEATGVTVEASRRPGSATD